MRRVVILTLVVVALAGLATACDSTGIPDQRAVPWVNIPFGRISGSTNGAIGVDGVMTGYMPCKDNRAPNDKGYVQDPFFGACVIPSHGGHPVYDSYSNYFRWTNNNSNNPIGLFLTNSGPCNDTSHTFCEPGQTLQHNWANKWTEFHLELYADDPAAAGVRLTVPCCPNAANGGAYTPVIGDITLPRSGGAGTSPLTASIANTTASKQIRLDAFQVDSVPSSRSSTGVPLNSFFSAGNGERVAQNAWAAPALYNGAYAVFITDLSRPSHVVVARINLPATTNLVLDRNKPCFGLGDPWDAGQWYNNVRLSPSQCQAMWS